MESNRLDECSTPKVEKFVMHGRVLSQIHAFLFWK